MNTTMQGSAADIVKCAMIKIQSELASAKLYSCDTQWPEARMVLQIHDELLLEVKPACLQQAKDIVRRSMESVVEISVPLPVKISVGLSWGELMHVDETQ